MAKDEEWVTTAQARTISGYSIGWLHELARRGTLTKRLNAGLAYWRRSDLVARRDTRPYQYRSQARTRPDANPPPGYATRKEALEASGLSERQLDKYATECADCTIRIGARVYWRLARIPIRQRARFQR